MQGKADLPVGVTVEQGRGQRRARLAALLGGRVRVVAAVAVAARQHDHIAAEGICLFTLFTLLARLAPTVPTHAPVELSG